MRAIKNKLIVKVQLEAEKSESGIIVDTEKKPDRGIVTSIGKEVTDEIKVGDTVVFSQFAGKAEKIGEDNYVLLNEGEVYYAI
jgi:chaperonin GroES